MPFLFFNKFYVSSNSYPSYNSIGKLSGSLKKVNFLPVYLSTLAVYSRRWIWNIKQLDYIILSKFKLQFVWIAFTSINLYWQQSWQAFYRIQEENRGYGKCYRNIFEVTGFCKRSTSKIPTVWQLVCLSKNDCKCCKAQAWRNMHAEDQLKNPLFI